MHKVKSTASKSPFCRKIVSGKSIRRRDSGPQRDHQCGHRQDQTVLQPQKHRFLGKNCLIVLQSHMLWQKESQIPTGCSPHSATRKTHTIPAPARKAYQDEKHIYRYKYQHMFRLFTHLLSSFLPFVTRENTNSIPKIRMEIAEL